MREGTTHGGGAREGPVRRSAAAGASAAGGPAAKVPLLEAAGHPRVTGRSAAAGGVAGTGTGGQRGGGSETSARRRATPPRADVTGELSLFIAGAPAAARRLARAAMALDDQRMLEIIRVSLACDETIPTWEDLLVPVLTAMGEHTARTGDGMAGEQLLCSCAAAAFTDIWSRLSRPAQRPVLLCCAAGEQHTLATQALAASLAERGIASRLLGPGLPGSAIAAAASRVQSAAVFVWSQTSATGDPAALAHLAAADLPAQIIAGGRGWRREGLPAAAACVSYLPEAVSAIAAALTSA
jgi:hypothetical protein